MRSTNALESDWSDDTATLIYDSPARQAEYPVLFATAHTAEPARVRTPRFSGGQIVVVVVAALIGAMAGAWSTAELTPGAAPIRERRTAGVAKPAGVERPAQIAAAAPSEPAKAASVVMNPSVAAAAPEPPSTPVVAVAVTPVAATAVAAPEAEAPAAQAAPPEAAADAEVEPQPQPVKPAITTARDRRRHRTAARSRSRSSGAAQSRSAAMPIEAPAPKATPSAEPPAIARMGRLRINSRPWSKIFIDGQPAGNTPQAAIELTPGRHLVALISDEFDLKRTLTIEVRAGETVTRSVELLQ